MPVAEQSPPVTDGDRRRDRRPVLALVGLVVVALVAAGGWWGWTSYAVSGLEVAWDGAPSCTGTKPARDGHAFEVSEEMRCDITVTVRNTGPVSLRLDRATLPFVGPDGGSVLEAVPVDGRAPTRAAESAIDAVVPLDHTLGSGESWSFRVRIAFRDDGCTDAGRLSFHDWPAITASSLGRDLDVVASESLVAVSERQNPGCPGLGRG
jgi:hypothetical protein